MNYVNNNITYDMRNIYEITYLTIILESRLLYESSLLYENKVFQNRNIFK